MATLYIEGQVSIGVIYIPFIYFGNNPEPFPSHYIMKWSTKSLPYSASPDLKYHFEEEKKVDYYCFGHIQDFVKIFLDKSSSYNLSNKD